MANQITAQNQTLTVPGISLPSGDSGGSVSISTKGPDAGYIVGAKDSSLQTVSYLEAEAAYQNPLNQSTINSALSLTPPGFAKEVSGVIDESAYNAATSSRSNFTDSTKHSKRSSCQWWWGNFCR